MMGSRVRVTQATPALAPKAPARPLSAPRIRRGRPAWPRRHRLAKWRERLRAHYPRADAGQEILREERSKRLIFPRLDVARRPVIEQAETGDMLARLSDWDRLPELVAGSDPEAKFE